MNKKIFMFLISGIMISVSASSQTIKDKIDKAHADKNAKENSGKADVLIQKKVIADDSTKVKITPVKVVSRKQNGKLNYTATIKSSKKKYKRKSKTTSSK